MIEKRGLELHGGWRNMFMVDVSGIVAILRVLGSDVHPTEAASPSEVSFAPSSNGFPVPLISWDPDVGLMIN